MGYVSGVLQTALPVFLVLAIGSLCRRSGKVSREGLETLKTVAVEITLPAVLLKAFATAAFDLRSILLPLLILAVCMLSWGLGKGVSCLAGQKRSFTPFITSGFEAGMLGFTFFAMLYPQASTASFALVDLGQELFVFTIYKGLLNAEFTENSSKKELLLSMIRTPVIIAAAVGVLLGASGLYALMETMGVSPIFDSCVSFLSAPTSVLILLSIGYDLELKRVDWGSVLKTVLLRFAILLALMWATQRVTAFLFPGDGMLLKAIAVMFILPPPYVLPVFADDRKQTAYLSSVLSVSTVFSVAAFAVLAVLEQI